MMVEGSSSMADASIKTSLPRKSAFSCEACRKRKVGACRADSEITNRLTLWIGQM